MDLTDVSEVKETAADFADEFTFLLFVALGDAVYLTGREYEEHTPQLPPLEQCAHLLQFEQALQYALPVHLPSSLGFASQQLAISLLFCALEVNVVKKKSAKANIILIIINRFI
ncbi:hypothetical protein AAYQ05_16190 [Flavobacterium sp. B11]|uniref:hypothetical protein n=1 Tax=Flavobacterium movens TaxID=214860 RepID=UPI0031D99645